MNILIVEDEFEVMDLIIKILKRIPYFNVVDTAPTFDEGFSKSLSGAFDLILIDIYLGKGENTGIDICKTIRKQDEETTLIMLTGCHSVKELERSFEAGANDYIIKPFNRRELELRIKRWVHMTHKIVHSDKIVYNDLVFDINQNEFFFKGNKLNLTKKDKIVMSIFMKKPETLLSQSYLQGRLWGDYDLTKNRNLRSNIQYLRDRLSPFCNKWIKTVRGEGYLLQKN